MVDPKFTGTGFDAVETAAVIDCAVREFIYYLQIYEAPPASRLEPRLRAVENRADKLLEALQGAYLWAEGSADSVEWPYSVGNAISGLHWLSEMRSLTDLADQLIEALQDASLRDERGLAKGVGVAAGVERPHSVSDVISGLHRLSEMRPVMDRADQLIKALGKAGPLGSTTLGRTAYRAKLFSRNAGTPEPGNGRKIMSPHSIEAVVVATRWLSTTARSALEHLEGHKKTEPSERRGPHPRGDLIRAIARSLDPQLRTSWNAYKNQATGPLVLSTRNILIRLKKNAENYLKEPKNNVLPKSNVDDNKSNAMQALADGLCNISDHAIQGAIKRGR